jgi:hypothetical protein
MVNEIGVAIGAEASANINSSVLEVTKVIRRDGGVAWS